MNKNEAIDRFIRDNYQLLHKHEQFDRKLFTQIKREYFGKKLKYSFGIPPNKEICDHFVGLIIKNETISSEEDLEQLVQQIAFLKLNKVATARYKAAISLAAKTYAMKEELTDYKGLERIEKEIEWVTKEHTQDIEDAIIQKQDEYRRLPSILDEEDFEEPEEPTQTKKESEWWDDINLRDNPFQGSLDGFSTIDKTIHEQIIVETPPIKWALEQLGKDSIVIFHKGFLLDGEFGTGKTTFYDFIAPHFTRKRVEPIRIAMTECINEAFYVQKFERAICIAISKLVKQYNPQRADLVQDITEARLQMMDLQKVIKGYFIFIDDLHKHTDVNLVFRFLSHLQIVKNNFSRDGINVVFITAGLPDWRENIKKDAGLLGFFDASHQLNLPEVTPTLAAQAIKQRLQAYSLNPNKEIGVREEFLASVFNRVRVERGEINIGFRPYIQEAVHMFEQKQFDILTVNITVINPEISRRIKSKLDLNRDFSMSVNKLIFGGGIQKQKVRDKTLRILCETYLTNGIIEGEYFFESQRFYFKRLSEAGLIIKTDREVDGNHKLVWKVSPFLIKLNKQIIDEFQLSMEDYLISIYSASFHKLTLRKELTKVQIYEQDLKQWQKKSLDGNVLISLQKALAGYSEHIFSFNYSKSFSPTDLPPINKIEEVIWTMMKTIIRYESPLLLEICGETNIEGWWLRHRSLECSQQFIHLIRSARTNNFTATDNSRLLSFADEAFGELWNELKQSIAVQSASGTTCYMLPKSTLHTIFTEYDTLLSTVAQRTDYFDSLEKFITEIEQSIRQYLLVCCSLIFGPYHIRMKHYPKDIRQYITKVSPSQSNSYESYNEFNNLNRGQYRLLFTNTGNTTSFHRYVIRPVIVGWSSQDLEAFFKLFGDINIITSHKKLDSIDETKRALSSLFRLACRLIADMSTQLKVLLTVDNIILDYNTATKILFGSWSQRYRGVSRKVKPEEISIPEGVFEHDITEALQSNVLSNLVTALDPTFGFFNLDMLDISGTIIKSGREFSEVISLIAYSLTNNKLRGIPLYGAAFWLCDIS